MSSMIPALLVWITRACSSPQVYVRNVGFQLAHVHLRLISDALFDFRVSSVDKVSKSLLFTDWRKTLRCLKQVLGMSYRSVTQ